MGRNALIFRWRAQSSSLSYVFYLSIFAPYMLCKFVCLHPPFIVFYVMIQFVAMF